MIYLNVLLTAKDARSVESIAAALKRAGALSQKEPGCHRWEAYHAEADPTRFLLVEQWETEADLDRHRQAEAYTTIYQKEVLPFVDRQPLRGTKLI